MSKPIKLLRIAATPDDRKGGMSRAMRYTSDYMASNGFQIRHLFLDAFTWKVPRPLARFTQPWEAGVRMRQAVKDWGGCDLVEVHEPLAIGCHRRPPGDFHPELVGFSHGVEQRSRKQMLDYRRRSSSSMPLKTRLTSLIQSKQSIRGLQRCDHVVCLNTEDQEYLQTNGLDRNRIHVHFNGVSKTLLDRAPERLPKAYPRILFLGTWIERKGIREAVPSCTSILEQNPEIEFTVAGCHREPTDIRSHFPVHVRERVRVIPTVNGDEELREIYTSHEILLLPSYFEGHPLVMLEAAACRMAVLTTPVCGMRDFILNGNNGVFAGVGSVPQFTEALADLVAHPEKVHALGEEAHKSAAKHSWEASGRNLSRVYKEIAAASC